MSNCRLRRLFELVPEVVKESMAAPALQADFFDDCVALLQDAPLVHPTAFQDYADSARARGEPGGEPTGDAELRSFCLYLATAVVLRSLIRSGFLAFCGLQSESIGVHRRTLEGIQHIEMLLDKPELSASYLAHANETERKKKKGTEWYSAFRTNESKWKDSKHNPACLSPLLRTLQERGQYGQLDAGAHAGLIHAITGFGPEGLGFFDRRGSHAGRYAFRYAWETMQLCNALQPKLTWIDANKWSERLDELQKQARVIESHFKEQDRVVGPPAPWSSHRPLPDRL